MNQIHPLKEIVLIVANHMTIPIARFPKKSLLILHLNIYYSLLCKIDKIYFIVKESNASITAISEFKLDSSILNNELDVKSYDLFRLDCSRRGGGVVYSIRKTLSYN